MQPSVGGMRGGSATEKVAGRGGPLLSFQAQFTNKEWRGDQRSPGKPLLMEHSSSSPGTQCFHKDGRVFFRQRIPPAKNQRALLPQLLRITAGKSLYGFWSEAGFYS